MMNKWRYALQQAGVSYKDHQSSNHRIVEVSFSLCDTDNSDTQDTQITSLPGKA